MNIVSLVTSISIGALIIVAAHFYRYVEKEDCAWKHLALIGAAATIASCAVIASPPIYLSHESIIRFFYVGASVLVGSLTYSLWPRTQIRLIIAGSSAFFAVASGGTDLVVEGALQTADYPSRIPGSLYLAFLAWITLCIALQIIGSWRVLHSLQCPRERNRLRWNMLALSFSQLCTAVLVLSMLAESPVITAPHILPSAAALTLGIFIYTISVESLPLLARRSSPDHMLYEEHAWQIEEAMSRVPHIGFAEAQRQLLDTPEIKMLPTPRKSMKLCTIGGSANHHAKLYSLAWCRALEQDVVLFASMQPQTKKLRGCVTFDDDGGVHTVDRHMYRRH